MMHVRTPDTADKIELCAQACTRAPGVKVGVLYIWFFPDMSSFSGLKICLGGFLEFGKMSGFFL